MESTPVSRPPTIAGAATARPAAMATMLTPESDDSLTPLGAIGGLIPARGAGLAGPLYECLVFNARSDGMRALILIYLHYLK